MKQPELSPYMMARKPSGIRLGQIKFLERKNPPILVNGSIGNVMRPMHPAMQRRLFNLGGVNSPFHNGIVPYVPTTGTDECREAFLHILRSQGFDTTGLDVLVTDGASMAWNHHAWRMWWCRRRGTPSFDVQPILYKL